MATAGRWIAVVAIVVLLLDGVLLIGAGLLADRPILLGLGGAGLAGAAAVWALWRRQRRRWDEITAARTAARHEIEALAETLRRSRAAE